MANGKALQFKSLEEFKTLILGDANAKIDVFPSKSGSKSAYWWLASTGMQGTVDSDLDPTTAEVVRMAEFPGHRDSDGVEHPDGSTWCMVAGLAPVISF